MNSRQRFAPFMAFLLAVIGLVVWFQYSRTKSGTVESVTGNEEHNENVSRYANLKERNTPHNSSFPINDQMELLFLGKIRCHARQETVQFTAKGKQMKWPFKVYYLPSGMFVRAEFTAPTRKDYEFSRVQMEDTYRGFHERLAGFPEKAAPASLGKVLQSLYENDPFDSASKINITWILREGPGGQIHPCFIANIWGVSQGLMRVPDEDEGFLKYRILLTPEGEAVRSDNFL